jgi:hypothetical protein
MPPRHLRLLASVAMSDPQLAQAGVSPQVRIRAGGPRDAKAVLAMLNGAVRWLVAHGHQGQWGKEPFSANVFTR